jgi:tetratricopeptide (TPR) repeat protein
MKRALASIGIVVIVAAMAAASWWLGLGGGNEDDPSTAAKTADELAWEHFEKALAEKRRGRASRCEEHLRKAMQHRSHFVEAERELAHLLTYVGRRWESQEPLFALVRHNHFTTEELALLGDAEVDFESPEEIERLLRGDPSDPMPLIAKARSLMHDGRLKEAERLLRKVVAARPDLSEAQASLGWTLLENPAQFKKWHARLPAGADRHPLTWIVRGKWAVQNDEPRPAIRCFWEALRLDPDNRTANYQLAQLLVRQGEAEAAKPFEERTARLSELQKALFQIFANRNDYRALQSQAQVLREAARLTEELGRLWEAQRWYHVIAGLGVVDTVENHSSPRAEVERDRLAQMLKSDSPRVMPQANPVQRIDLSSYPLPALDWPAFDERPESKTAGAARFSDMAIAAGIEFSYYNGHAAGKKGMPIHEVTGGGAAVIDFDGDRWPDIHFTQGGDWPAGQKPGERLDRLYRNLGNGRFQDVTGRAEVGDDRYSQGAACADFDSDGFPDLYIANLGKNRLYRNNGDGTFSDVSQQAGLAADDWTTSCLMADLNGDGLADIYDVNYVDHKTADITRLCNTDGQAARTCSPTVFDAAQDIVLLNRGDGTFADVTIRCGAIAEDGYGLGVIAADFDGSGRLSLFVANDDTANHYFSNQTAKRGEKLTLVEQAVPLGLAYDGEGRALACMGVAAGDANEDGRLDLFVTNFYDQACTLYLNDGDYFIDSIRSSGIHTGGYTKLGFGTQFLDADLDGRPDLIVANGHVDDYSYKGIPFEMPAQFFSNQGGARFVELAPATVGEFFSRRFLGRGLARLDWNRDGKEGAVFSHIGAPAALLTNETSGAGHYLALNFRGVETERDAIGVVATVKFGKRTSVQQLTAGDGYQASNQRQLIFGLGDANQADEVSIRWPSGKTHVFKDLAADAQWIVIENADAPVRMAAP